MSYRASIPNIGSISISNLEVYKETLPNMGSIRGKSHKLHLVYYLLQRQTLHHNPLATVLLGDVNSGASLDSLVLAYMWQGQEQYLHWCHGNKEPDKLNICKQTCKKGWKRQKTIWKPFSNSGCTFRQMIFTLSTVEQIPLTSTNISKCHADFHISINVLRFMYTTQKWPESLNHTSLLLMIFQLQTFDKLCGLLKTW